MQVKSKEIQSSNRSQYFIPWIGATLGAAWFIFQRSTGNSGFDLGFYNSLFIAAFLVSAILLLACFFKSVEHLGLIVLPATVICLAMNLLLEQPGTPVEYSIGIQTHIISSIIAFSILCLAAVQAIILLVQERHLKQHTAAGILRALPSLRENEFILFQTIVLGVLVLTIALATGFIFLDDIFAQHLVHKTVLSILAWIVFVILLWGRAQFGWRGPTAVRWTLGGFSFLILAFFGSKFVLELILSRT